MPEYGPILFVDDEASMRHAVTQWLGLAGFETLVHDKASSALNALSADFSGILVTDLKMEGMDGMELLRRSQQLDPELPVVVISGRGDAPRRLRLHREAVCPRALSRSCAASQREAAARGREPPPAARRQRADAELAHHRDINGG